MANPSVRLTLPLLTNGSPFALSEGEAAFSGDQWAWLFLRLNPRYRHDWALFKRTQQLRAGARENDKIVDRLGTVPTRLLGLDSRRFSFEQKPLDGGDTLGVKYKACSLKAAIERPHLDVQRIRWREFESAVDYGIGGWIDPRHVYLPHLGEGENWFYLSVEPIWGSQSSALRAGAVKWREAPDARRIIVGAEAPVQWGASWPDSQSTELDFLVCLDSDVQSQLRRVCAIATALNGQVDPPVRRDARALEFPRVFTPEAAQRALRVNLFASVQKAPSVQGLHWRHVVIDFAASLDRQFKALKKALQREKGATPGLKSFRQREGRRSSPDGDGDWLKKALATVEYLKVFVEAGLSQNAAIKTLAQEATVNSDLEGDFEGRLHQALKVGRALVAGQYRFLIDYEADRCGFVLEDEELKSEIKSGDG